MSRPPAAYAAYNDAVKPQASPGLVSRPPAAYVAHTSDGIQSQATLDWCHTLQQLMLSIVMLFSHKPPLGWCHDLLQLIVMMSPEFNPKI